MKKVFITGITGFAGSYLAEHLLSLGNFSVCGTYLSEESLSLVSSIQKDISLVKLNLLDAEKVSATIKEYKPDLVFHLAALTSPAESFKNPSETVTNNITAQINLMEAIRQNNLPETKMLVISSGDVYGAVDKNNLPIDEETALRPTNPYAVSKIAQDFLGLQYFLSYKMKIIRVRPFNHTGPKQSPNFVVSAFAKKIAEIEKGKREPILTVGNLETRRDFTDVRDMVKAYVLAIENGELGEAYNIGSGKAYKIADILDTLVKQSTVKIEIKVDSALLRPSDTPELVCDNNKFIKLTNWTPKIPLETTLKDTLDYWRNII
jgi:GDP-4-dehydro-6-deoxy-D-mannose reductase